MDQFRPRLHDHTIGEAGTWLCTHIRSGVERNHAALAQGRSPPMRVWQWSLTLLAWLFEEAGIVDLLRDRPDDAAMLLTEGAFSAAASRYHPLLGWRRGQSGCALGFTCFGSSVSAATVRRDVETCLAIPDEALAALNQLVADVEHSSREHLHPQRQRRWTPTPSALGMPPTRRPREATC